MGGNDFNTNADSRTIYADHIKVKDIVYAKGAPNVQLVVLEIEELPGTALCGIVGTAGEKISPIVSAGSATSVYLIAGLQSYYPLENLIKVGSFPGEKYS